MNRFTDLAVVRGADGIYDIDIDAPNRDAELDDGLYEAIFISLFSDRRAAADEVADPMKRRGWIGDLVADVPGDRHGSGLWLYAQSRLTPDIQAGIESDARGCLAWMVDDGLVSSVTVSTERQDAARQLVLNVTMSLAGGNVSRHAFVLANATRSGLLSNN